MRSEYNNASHCKYLTQYHVIWCPKFRYSVLNDDVTESLKAVLCDVCNSYGYEIKALEVMSDHVHMFVSAPHTVAPSDVAKTLKSVSAVKLLQLHPELRAFYARCGKLWSRGYFISTIGHISEETVKKYIEEQKPKD